jgi:hypothetical protein
MIRHAGARRFVGAGATIRPASRREQLDTAERALNAAEHSQLHQAVRLAEAVYRQAVSPTGASDHVATVLRAYGQAKAERAAALSRLDELREGPRDG